MTLHSLQSREPAAGVLAQQYPVGSPEQLMAEAVMRLTGLADAMRQTQADRRWSEITEKVWESGYNPAANAGDATNARAMVGEIVFVERVIVSVPAGATGVLQIGSETIPNLPAGVTSLPLGKIVGPQDTRSLTVANAGGAVFLALTGYQLAPTGGMAP